MLALYVENEELTFDTMFSFPVFLSVRGYLCKSAGVHFYDFLASYFEFDLF